MDFTMRGLNMGAEVMPRGELKIFFDGFRENPNFNSEGFMELYRDTDTDTVLRILSRFHDTLNQSFESISNACLQNESEPIWKAAHKVAGAAELLGFDTYGHSARDLSIRLKANPIVHNYKQELDEFLIETDLLRKKIQSTCPNLDAYLS